MGRKQDAESVWRGRLSKFRKSKLTVKEFCRQEGVSEPSFYRWRKRLDLGPVETKSVRRSQAQKPNTSRQQSFIPVRVPAPAVAFAEVEFLNGIRVRVPATNAEALRVAMTAGNEICREVD
jgi:hypothetical protein